MSLIRQLVPKRVMFDLFRTADNQAEENSRAPCTKPFFSDDWRVEFESGSITGHLAKSQKHLSLYFAGHYQKNQSWHLSYTLTEADFINRLEMMLDRKTDYVSIDIPYGSSIVTCAIQFDVNEVKQALAVYNGIEENNGGFNMNFSKMIPNFEIGKNKDPRIKSTYFGVAVQNPDNGRWYSYDPATHTRKDMMGIELGKLPIFLLPTQNLTPDMFIKYEGRYLWIKSVNNDNTFTAIDAMDGGVKTYVISSALFNIFGVNFFTEVVAIDFKTLTSIGTNKSLGGNIVGAMVMMSLMKGKDPEFSLNNINESSFDGLGELWPLLMASRSDLTNNQNLMTLLAVTQADSDNGGTSDMLKMAMWTRLLGGGNANTGNPFANLFGGLTGNVTASTEASATGDTYKCTNPECGATYTEAYPFCPKCGKPVEKVIVGKKCAHCGAVLPEGANYCPMCSKPVGPVVCANPKCGATLPEGANFCPACGLKVGEQPAAKEAAPAPKPKKAPKTALPATDPKD